VPKFGLKVPHLRCDSHTSFKVKRSKVRVRGGRGHTVSAEPAATLLVISLGENVSSSCLQYLSEQRNIRNIIPESTAYVDSTSVVRRS